MHRSTARHYAFDRTTNSKALIEEPDHTFSTIVHPPTSLRSLPCRELTVHHLTTPTFSRMGQCDTVVIPPMHYHPKRPLNVVGHTGTEAEMQDSWHTVHDRGDANSPRIATATSIVTAGLIAAPAHLVNRHPPCTYQTFSPHGTIATPTPLSTADTSLAPMSAHIEQRHLGC